MFNQIIDYFRFIFFYHLEPVRADSDETYYNKQYYNAYLEF